MFSCIELFPLVIMGEVLLGMVHLHCLQTPLKARWEA